MRYLAILDNNEEDLEDVICDQLGGMLVAQDEIGVLDARQGQAVKELLMAFDLPIEAGTAGHLMLLASFFQPQATIGTMGSDNRKAGLERARALIDQMLEDL